MCGYVYVGLFTKNIKKMKRKNCRLIGLFFTSLDSTVAMIAHISFEAVSDSTGVTLSSACEGS